MHDLVLREKAITPVSGRGRSALYGKLAATSVVALSLLAFAAQPAAARGAPDSFADLAEKVSPAVVNIAVEKNISGVGYSPENMPEGGGREFFKRFFGDRSPNSHMPEGSPGGQPRQTTGVGSGFIIDEDGYVVTNHHVIDGASKITVTLADGRTMEAELVGSDQRTDLALLKIEAEADFPFVEFGESEEVRVGDWVMAVGNPFGLGGTVTVGVVSARGRDLRGGSLVDYVQIDAPINRGNSGGPTFNQEGEVIGINTAIFSPSGGSVGIGFAIPADTAEDIIDDLKDDGKVARGWLGVRIQPVTAEIAEGFGLDEDKGALVSKVEANSPAAKAGLKVGDVILAWDGEEIERFRDLPRYVAASKAESEVQVKLWRDRAETSISVTTGLLKVEQVAALMAPEAKKEATDEVTLPDSGMTLAELNDERRQILGLDEEMSGVLVVSVAPGSAAAEAGFTAGDIIASVNLAEVSTPAAVIEAVELSRESGFEMVPVLVSRSGDQRFVSLRVEAA
jgi:serine protease Do